MALTEANITLLLICQIRQVIMSQDLKELQISIQKKVGNNIQNIREEKGLSQVDLASRMLGRFDTTNISRIESGRTNPTLFTLYRISEALEVPLSDLMDVSLED